MFGAIRGIVVARGCDGTTKTEAMLFEETKMSVYTGLGEFDLVFLFALPGNKHLVMRSFALVSIIISSFFLPWNTMRVQSYWIDRKHFQVATFLHRYATTSPTFSCIFPVWIDTSLSLPGITGASEAFEYLLVFLQNTVDFVLLRCQLEILREKQIFRYLETFGKSRRATVMVKTIQRFDCILRFAHGCNRFVQYQ